MRSAETGISIKILRLFPCAQRHGKIASLLFPVNIKPRIGTELLTANNKTVRITGVAFDISMGENVWDCIINGDLDALEIDDLLFMKA